MLLRLVPLHPHHWNHDYCRNFRSSEIPQLRALARKAREEMVQSAATKRKKAVAVKKKQAEEATRERARQAELEA